MFTWAIKRRIAPKGWVHPCRSIERQPEHNEKTRFLSDDELDRVLAACKASSWPRLYLLVLAAITTGARKGELLGLRWGDIDLDRATAHVGRSKNGDPKVLPLVPAVVAELRRFEGKPAALVFPSPRRPDQPFAFEIRWHEALKAAKVKNATFHDAAPHLRVDPGAERRHAAGDRRPARAPAVAGDQAVLPPGRHAQGRDGQPRAGRHPMIQSAAGPSVIRTDAGPASQNMPSALPGARSSNPSMMSFPETLFTFDVPHYPALVMRWLRERARDEIDDVKTRVRSILQWTSRRRWPRRGFFREATADTERVLVRPCPRIDRRGGEGGRANGPVDGGIFEIGLDFEAFSWVHDAATLLDIVEILLQRTREEDAKVEAVEAPRRGATRANEASHAAHRARRAALWNWLDQNAHRYKNMTKAAGAAWEAQVLPRPEDGGVEYEHHP